MRLCVRDPLRRIWQAQDVRETCKIQSHYASSGMQIPKISTNLAVTVDGKTSSWPSRPSGWTSCEDHNRLLELRSNADAIIVGRGTWKSDRMTLTVKDKTAQPLRCIVSHKGELDLDHPIFTTPGGDIHLLITDSSRGEIAEALVPKVTVHRKSLTEFVTSLAVDYKVKRLHCEGGGQLIQTLAELDVIDEFHLTLAGHTIFGGQHASTATGIPADFLTKSNNFRLSLFKPNTQTGECFLSYTRRQAEQK